MRITKLSCRLNDLLLWLLVIQRVIDNGEWGLAVGTGLFACNPAVLENITKTALESV
jgi:hypothetical protein